MRTNELITDEQVLLVHGSADFGNMTPREAIDDGVFKVSMGFGTGHTQYTILREHRLVTKPNKKSYLYSLTQKGKRYLRAMYSGGRIRFF
jgi:hypothetical protein